MTAVFREPVQEDKADTTGFELVPLAGRIGAEVRGLRASGALPPAVFARLHQALLKHRVLFLRGQHHLDDAGHEDFARLWGELEPHPTVPAPEGTHFFELDSQHGGRANSWHTDVTFRAAPPKVAVLRAVLIPPLGGDTVWANTVAAYEGLPEPLKRLAGQLRAVHGNDYDYAAHRHHDGSEREADGRRRHRQLFVSTRHEAEHPVVHVHPETGERALLLGHFVKRLVGFSTHDARHLLDVLHAHVHRPENTVRWQWAQGDLAIWDNHSTQHYAINDYGDERRIVRRATVGGEPLSGIDGQRSVQLEPALA
ncbi:TauD/TfdA dioxygenase family protein [Caldimonas tepidiphila]|uniref:TauD/TfdA dioxygenase family protein n=1 Tax=Caldimonas tepidiphila TaxID=2315841 RepID=UPI000E5C1BDA|nr:TauD/TfdA family dioxygenase [Caldimonas tepidiphila]